MPSAPCAVTFSIPREHQVTLLGILQQHIPLPVPSVSPHPHGTEPTHNRDPFSSFCTLLNTWQSQGEPRVTGDKHTLPEMKTMGTGEVSLGKNEQN